MPRDESDAGEPGGNVEEYSEIFQLSRGFLLLHRRAHLFGLLLHVPSSYTLKVQLFYIRYSRTNDNKRHNVGLRKLIVYHHLYHMDHTVFCILALRL